jgi:CHAT domain-containing protein
VKGLAVHEGNPQRGPGGPSRLHKVKDEVHRVRERFEAAEATITVVNDTTDHPTVPGVLGCLQDPNMNVLHLSCHGEQKETSPSETS